jgi:predicted esterase
LFVGLQLRGNKELGNKELVSGWGELDDYWHMSGVRWVLGAACVAAVAVFLVDFISKGVRAIEARMLLQPKPNTRYRFYDGPQWRRTTLPRGGLLLSNIANQTLPRVNPNKLIDDRPNLALGLDQIASLDVGQDRSDGGSRRHVMLLHGNAGDADGMFPLATLLTEMGYRVHVLEYAGYGEAWNNVPRLASRHDLPSSLGSSLGSSLAAPSSSGANHDRGGSGRLAPEPRTLIDDLADGWREIPSRERASAILLGFSIGGGAVLQGLASSNVLPTNDLPAQIVVFNTFFDLPALASAIVASAFVPIPGLSYLVHTRWNASDGLKRYARDRAQLGQVAHLLIISTANDELMPRSHAEQLQVVATQTGAATVHIVLPDGGHNNALSPLVILPPSPDTLRWTNQLLSPIPTPLTT